MLDMHNTAVTQTDTRAREVAEEAKGCDKFFVFIPFVWWTKPSNLAACIIYNKKFAICVNAVLGCHWSDEKN